ncbi:hypothetical protein IM793_18160 [Pedobacter sp. MR2016-19]|uniref:hypothetical protein n=1 Tax=Pedobacter sp. MR2016-19 TaxID=2780089 RepID=UPI0018737080|nr:hypothetical protein [Pedobacter sp. MR2016-19]MBE5321096.1 hypothetical protein [Pedobacter sp. MR2016-19]
MKHKIYYLLILALLFSCKKEIKKENLSPAPASNEKQDAKVIFSKILAIALEKEPNLRLFIKNEALKQFDRDNDVLFQMIKDEKVTTDQTFHQVISKYAKSKEKLDSAINSLPTLTIMVPELPNFTPNNWKTESEVPQVAISPENKNFKDIDLYNSKGELTKIAYGAIPNFPVVVVKENERVNVSVNNIDKSPISATLLRNSTESNQSSFLSKDNMKFIFSNEAFNGMKTSSFNKVNMSSSAKLSLTNDNKISRTVNVNLTNEPNSIDPSVIEAFNINLDWHRDYIYYGLNPNLGINKGKFNNRMIEHIVSIRMKDGNYNRISDQTQDPTVSEQWVQPRPERGGYVTNWTDGYFDIRISILINAKNGAGTQLNKVISAKGSDLYDIKYRTEGIPGRSGSTQLRFDGLTPKDYIINEPIAAWDLQNYGAAWKFIVSEYDPSEEIITTYNESSKFATNFNYELGFEEKVKVGYKFGISLETTSSSTYQYKTTRGSDELGEGILEFGSPIILKKEQYTYSGRNGTVIGYNYITNEVSCGTIYLAIEPRKI